MNPNMIGVNVQRNWKTPRINVKQLEIIIWDFGV